MHHTITLTSLRAAALHCLRTLAALAYEATFRASEQPAQKPLRRVVPELCGLHKSVSTCSSRAHPSVGYGTHTAGLAFTHLHNYLVN